MSLFRPPRRNICQQIRWEIAQLEMQIRDARKYEPEWAEELSVELRERYASLREYRC